MIATGRYAAVDVCYPPAGGAVAALVIAADAAFGDVIAEHVTTLDQVAPYRPAISPIVNCPPSEPSWPRPDPSTC